MAKASTGAKTSARGATPVKVKPAAPVAAAGKAKAAPKKVAAGKAARPTKPVAALKPVAGNRVPVKVVAKKSAAPKTPAKKQPVAKIPTAKVPAAKAKAPVKQAAVVSHAPARKAAAKSVAVKKAEPRRPATRTAVPAPAARRSRPGAAPRPAAAKKPAAKPAQSFTVSHLNEADFKADGLRAYAQYRDLGIAVATGGLCQAHVIRFVPPCTDEVRKRHVHQADLQLIYVLKGWMKNEFEGHGEQMMSAGSCWLQPSGIKHTVLDYSADCEVLEIIVPADFKTEELI